MENLKVKVICLTPVRNNGNILDRFLSAASLWADYIIVCDQMSTDNSREIAHRFPKVILIDNPTEEYNESVRQKLLIEEARKIVGPRLLITLDADEIFTPNVFTSSEWQSVLSAKPGTIIKFQWANLGPDLKTMWLGYHFPWGYMDDGYRHEEEKKIHNGRIPIPSNHDVIYIQQVKVIHFQFTDWPLMESKHRFYQCFETLNFPSKSAVDIFRQYHHMLAIPKSQIVPIPNEWILEYSHLGIDILTVNFETKNWFDGQTLKLIEKNGAKVFKKLNIWDVNWVEIAELWNKTNLKIYKDPRNIVDKFIQSWLLKTQTKLDKRRYRRTDRLIKYIFKY